MTVEAQLTINANKAAVWAATMDIARFAWMYYPQGIKIKLWVPKSGLFNFGP